MSDSRKPALRWSDLRDDPDLLISEVDLCQLTGKSLKSAQNDRCAGVGIPFIRLSRTVRYRASDVLEYVDRGRVETRRASEVLHD